MNAFPQAFLDELGVLFDKETLASLLLALESTPPVSIRLNPAFKGKDCVPQEKVHHTEYGYFLPDRPVFTADPAFHAGAYYPQEAN